MNTHPLPLSGLVFGLLCLLNVSARADDPQDIRRTFETFKASVLSGDTNRAASVLAPSLHEYFNRIKPLAVTTPTSAPVTEKQPPVDHLVTAILRAKGGPNLPQQDIAQVAADGIKNGWIRAEGLRDVAMGEITINASSAAGTIIYKGNPTRWAIPFIKTASGWKIDPMASYSVGDLLLKAEIIRNGMDEQRTINNIVNSLGTGARG